MTRIILVSGKGGVGKTTVAAATAASLSRQHRKTLILSFDLAHSLRDSFGLGGFIEMPAGQDAFAVDQWLDIKELDVSREVEKEWGPVYRHMSRLMSGGGLDQALSQELAMLPGMEDISALLVLSEYVKAGRYDTIVLDCPPTASTLRFIGMASGLKWYAENRLTRERALAKALRPVAQLVSREAFYLPSDDFFGTFAAIVQRLDSLEALLQDPAVTSLRLVTNPERMVLRETQRAFLYLSIYGIAVDQIIVNRVFSTGEPYFEGLAASQRELIETIEEDFEGVPCARVPFLAEEVVGIAALERFAATVYGDRDPGAVLHDRTPVQFHSADDALLLEVAIPFAEKDEIDVSRQEGVLLIRAGTFKRRITLPDAAARFPHNDAVMKDNKLTVRFHA